MKTDTRVEHIKDILLDGGYLGRDEVVWFKPMNHRTNNPAYWVQRSGGTDLFVKQEISVDKSPHYQPSAFLEAETIKELEGLRLTPTFIDFLPEAQNGPLLIYEFYPGTHWATDVVDVANLLKKLHTTYIGSEKIAGVYRHASMTPYELIQETDKILEHLPDKPPRLISHFENFPTPSLPAPTPTLIHTNCGASNIIEGFNGLRLIDWQFPAYGDPVEDLVAFTSPAMQILHEGRILTTDELTSFLDAYDDAEVVGRFWKFAPYYHLRFAAYCAFRVDSLAKSRPEDASLMTEALSAELTYLDSL